MTELEAYKLLVQDCWGVQVNLNDTFYFACADYEELEGTDIEELVPIIQKYGHDAIVAFCAVKRGHDPKIKQHVTENYKKAKKEIEDLAEDGSILFEEYYDRKEMKEDMVNFGGQIIEWTDITRRFVKILKIDTRNGVTVIRKASLEDGTFAIGKSTNEIKTRLLQKYRRKSGNQS